MHCINIKINDIEKTVVKTATVKDIIEGTKLPEKDILLIIKNRYPEKFINNINIILVGDEIGKIYMDCIEKFLYPKLNDWFDDMNKLFNGMIKQETLN
jgi:hypothetical protein